MQRRRALPPLLVVALAAGATACRKAPPAADVVQKPAPAPSAPVADPVRYGPWLLEPGPSSVTVAWTGEGETAGRVQWGEAQGQLDRTAVEPVARREHRVSIEGLLPGRQYRYRVQARTPIEGSFWTAPAAGEDPAAQKPFRVLVYGDNRTDEAAHARVVKAAEGEGVRLALHTGDMVVDATHEELWASWFEVEHDLLSRTPLLATVGNHEITDRGVAYTAHFQAPQLPPYRSYDYGPVHVVVLDSFEVVVSGAQPREGSISDAQRAWLEQDLKAVPQGKHVWVLVHQGPFSHPLGKGHGGSPRVREVLMPFKDRIEAVFAGHDHFYERGQRDGLRYFVLGGGGAPLYEPKADAPGVQVAIKSLSYAVLEVCGCHVQGQVKDPSGKVLDSFQLATCPQACPASAPQAAAGREAGQR
jgi:hypothetical protein